MPFLAVGVEHTSAPLAVRERASLTGEARTRAAQTILADPTIDEAVILSTCNRTELYLYAEDQFRARATAEAILAGEDAEIMRYVRQWEDMDAVDHLFRVATGLESQVLGEPQILSQVREAFEAAQGHGTVGSNLHSLFRSAISCSRQARAGTALGRLNPSVAQEAILAAASAIGGAESSGNPLADCAVLVMGAGEIARLVADELSGRVQILYIANRTESVAVELALQLNAQPAPFAQIPRLLSHVDLVISATGSRHYVLGAEDVPAMPDRSSPLHIFDLAMPRDIDPEVGELGGVSLHDLDSLLPDSVRETWHEDVRIMEGVVAAEVHEFMAWYLTRRVAPVIANLRGHVEAVQAQELRRVSPQLSDLTERERAAVESLTGRLVDKMFHHLVLRLRLAAQTDPKLVEAAEFFFLHGEGSLFAHAADLEKEQAAAPNEAP